jgi:tetratricopeptide (TPR) repeat protein
MPEKRRLVAANSSRFKTWGVYELLLERSWGLRGVNRTQSEELAMLALDLSQHLDAGYYKTELIEDLRARAWTFVANLRRITSDYLGAEEAFQKAYTHLKLGTREPLERAMYLDLRASLRTSQRRFPEAMTYLERAVTIFLHQGDTHRAGKSLVNLANVYSFADDDQKAFATLEQALPLIDPAQDERLLLCARHNQIDYLTIVGRFLEARALFHQTLPLYLKYNDLEFANRCLWIRGRIARGFGQTASAEQFYRAAQTGFVNAANSHEAALVSFELAVLLAEQNRAAELKTLAVEMLAIFSSHHIHREALAAVLFLKQATDVERLNFETATAVNKFVRRALVDPTLKFEASSVLLG